MRKIIILGRIPSKKNSLRRVFAKGRLLTIPSKQHEEWHKEQMWVLKGNEKIQNIELLQMVFYAPDNRRADSFNKAESIADLLVDAGIIEDDSWFVLPQIELFFGGVDKKNPRCEVYIYERNQISPKTS